MKRLIWVALALMIAVPARAEVFSKLVCDSVTLAANTTTDCTYTDLSKYKYFSYQLYCGETTGDTMSIDVDWVAGSGASSSYMGIPILSTGSAMSQLKTAYTTEDAWSVLQSISPPCAPVGTIRLTENNNDADIVCSVILNMGN